MQVWTSCEHLDLHKTNLNSEQLLLVLVQTNSSHHITQPHLCPPWSWPFAAVVPAAAEAPAEEALARLQGHWEPPLPPWCPQQQGRWL